MYKLVDYKTKYETGVEFGTCEYCFSVGDLEREFLIFEDENGDRFEWENGYWDWGDYDTYIYIENVIDFAYYIDKTGLNSIHTQSIINKADEYSEWLRVKNLEPYQKALEDLGYRHYHFNDEDYFEKGNISLIVRKTGVIKYKDNVYAKYNYPEEITRNEWKAINMRWSNDD